MGKTFHKFVSLKSKLTLIVFIPLFFIIVGGVSFIVVNDYQRLQNEVINNHHQFNEVITQEIVKLIIFDTVDVAADVTMKLRQNDDIKFMRIFDKDNNPVYEYLKEGENRNITLPETFEHQHILTEDTAMMVHELRYQDTNYGHVVMHASIQNLLTARQSFIKQLMLIALALTFISAFLASLLQRYFSIPINNLSNIIQTVIDTDELSIIPESEREDEIGKLFRGFRKMQQSLIKKDETLRSSEQLYRQIFETNQAIKLIIDADNGRIVQANKAALNFYGYNLASITAMKISDINQLTENEVKTEIQKALNEERLFFNFKHRIASGEIRDVEAYSGPVVINNKTFLFSIIHDITDRVMTEEALRRSQKMDAIGQLTGGIAHDFNNILNIILGSLSLLEREIEGDEKTKKRIDTIKHSSLRAADLVKQLLLFSRNEPACLSSININKLIGEIGGLIKHSITPQIEIIYQLDDNLWQTEIDSGDFEDALLNIIINAKDAMPEGGKLVIETSNRIFDQNYCSLNSEISAGEYIELVISDDGMGMNSEQQKHIFEPFYTTKEIGKGTGLGMSMVFGFVQRSGGSINVYSEPNIGTTLQIYLPRNTNTKTHVQIDEPQEKTIIVGGNESILIVDDEAALLNIIEEALKKNGYTVHTAKNGKDALKILEAHSDIALLFSDVVMPDGINGYQLADTVAKRYPNIKIILTSGFTGSATVHNGPEKFSADILSKPYTLSEMAHRIRLKLSGI